MYRVLVVKPNGDKSVINYNDQFTDPAKELFTESTLHHFIADDELSFDVDPGVKKILRQRVSNKGHQAFMAGNSIFEIFLPVFSLNQIELKMAVICLALVLSLGITPTNNHAPDRNSNMFFLADTLSDTSVYCLPAVHDSAGKLQFK
jgi:hypothetical protein